VYQAGERYLLFLVDMGNGPLGLTASANGMMCVLAPEGRYLITQFQPVTLSRGFAPQWPGRSLADIEAKIADSL